MLTGKQKPDKATVDEQIATWVVDKNNAAKMVDWQFSIEDAKAKLKRLYPKLGF